MKIKFFQISQNLNFFPKSQFLPLKEKKEEEKREKIRKALELREKGWSFEKIAKELGVGKATVIEWIDRSEMAKTSKSDRLSLLLPDGTPSSEGLRLWSEHVEQSDVKTPNDVFSASGFYTFLKNKSYEVEHHGQFIAKVREEINTYLQNATRSGLSETEIRTLLSRAKRGIFEHISSTAKAKLAGMLKEYIRNLVKEREEREKEEKKILTVAENILREPKYVFSSWYNLAKLVMEKLEEMGERIRHRYTPQEVSKILQNHSNTLLDIYKCIPEVSEEELKEIAKHFELEEFENLKQFEETLKAQVIQEGKRPAGVETFAISLWNEYQSQKLKEESLDDSLEEVEDEEEYIRRRVEEQLPDFEKTWERIFGNQEKQEEKKEEKPKLKRGRPPKEKKEMSAEEQYLLAIQQIEYCLLWILDKWGREEAIKVVEQLLYELKYFSNEQLAEEWKEAYALALADKKIRDYEYWS